MYKCTETTTRRGIGRHRVFSTMLALLLLIVMASSAGAQEQAAIDYTSAMPPIGEQGPSDQGFLHNPSSTIATNRSGVAWATGYNYMSYQMTSDSGATSLSLPENIVSPYYTYTMGGTGEDNYSPEGTVSGFAMAMELFATAGAATMDRVPDLATPVTEDVLASAANNKIISYAPFFENDVEVQPGLNGAVVYASQFDNDVDQLRRHLLGTGGVQGDVFVLGIPVFESFLAQDASTTVTYDVDPLNLAAGDAFTGTFHAVCVVGVDDSRGAFRIANTWGTDWGTEGYKWLSFDFVEKYADQAWHMTYASRPGMVSNPSPPDATTYVPVVVNLSWSDANQADSYTVYFSAGATPTDEVATSLTASRYVVPGELAYETLYSWQVVAHNPSGVTAGPVWTFTTLPDLKDITPPSITGTVAVKATDTSAVIKWTTNEPATGVVLVQPGNISASQVGLSSAHIIEVEGLTPLTEYTATVSSMDASGNGPTTVIFTFKTSDVPDTTPPMFKGMPTITQITDASAILSFQTNEPVRGTVVIAGAGGSDTINITDLTSLFSETLTDLVASTTYTVTISLNDSRGNGPLTAVMSFLTDSAPDRESPEFESGPYAVDLSDKAVTIKFETSEFCTVKLIVENESTRIVTDLTAPGTVFSARMVGLTEATQYTALVVITDISGNGPVVTGITFTTRAQPDIAPPVISQVRLGASPNDVSADITWVTNEGATSLVKYGTTTDLGEEETFDGIDTSHLVTLTGLTPATKYYYQVVSSDSIGNGPSTSAIMDFDTDDVPDAFPPVVTDARLVFGNTFASFIVYSDEPARLSVRYRIAGTTNPYKEKVALMFRQTCRLKVTGLAPNTAYDFIFTLSDEKGNIAEVTNDVIAALSGSSSDLSASASVSSLFVTNLFPDTTLPVITGVEVLSITDTSVVVRWTTDEVSDSRLIYGVQGEILTESAVDSLSVNEHVLSLHGLNPETVYAFQVTSVDLAGNESVAGAVNTFTTAAGPDLDAPVFTAGPVAEPGIYKATISWVTDELATSEVNFGVNPANLRKVAGTVGVGLTHSVNLTNLLPGTLYYVKAITVDSSGNRSTSLIEVRTKFEPKTVGIVVIGDGAVTIDPAAVQYEHNSVVTLTAVPAVGSHFESWAGVDAAQTLNNPVNLLMNVNYKVTATFAVNLYPLMVTAENGSVEQVPAASTYAHGSVVMLTATPAEGFHFAGWSGDGVPAGADVNNPVLDVMMDGAKDIVANFAINTYTLSITVANGTVTADPDAAEYAHGTMVALTAAPAADYHFNGWTGDVPAGQEMTNPLVLTMVAAVSVTAEMEANPANTSALTVTATNGTVAVSPAPVDGVYANGTAVTLTATAAEGYEFTGWAGDATGTDNPLATTVDTNMTIEAMFAINTYTLSINAENGSVIADPAADTYNHGAVVSLTAVPAAGYRFAGWSGDGITTDTAMANPISITMDSDKVTSASFVANDADTYAITVFTTNGTVAMDPAADSYAVGTDVTLTATPDAGFYFAGWEGDAVTSLTAANNPLVLTVSGDMSVTAVFKAGKAGNFTLTLLATEGTVTRTPDPATYAPGSVVTISAMAMPTYHFTGWVGITTATEMMNPMTITMNSDMVIAATFAINTYAAPVITAENGTVEVAPIAAEYTYGDLVTLTATPAAGHDFTGWTGDVPVGMETANPLSLTITAALNLTAVFTPQSYALTVLGDANGSVDMLPVAATYFYGSDVTLMPVPAEGYHFSHWTGDVPAGMEEVTPLVINVAGPITIQANFSQDYAPASGDYLITYKNATISSDANGITFSGTIDKTSIKIKPLKKGVPAGFTPDENGFVLGAKPTQAYLVKSVLDSLVIEGSAGAIYSEVPIRTLTASGSVKSLTTKNSHVMNLDVAGIGSVKMTATLNSTDLDNPFIASTTIVSGAYAKPAKIALVGVVLDGLDAPSLSLKSITTSGKKLKDKVTKQKYGSFGGVEGDILVRDLKALTAKTAAINADSIETVSYAKTTKITAKGGVIAATVGAVIVEGNISSDIDVKADKLTVAATGGNITSSMIITTGEISNLSAKISKMKINGVKNYVGGELGIELSGAQTAYSLFVSGSDAASAKKDIKKVLGSVAIKGVFMAGATIDPSTGVVTPTRAAALSKVLTAKLGKVPTAPSAVGEYYSNNTAKTSGGDFTLFEKK